MHAKEGLGNLETRWRNSEQRGKVVKARRAVATCEIGGHADVELELLDGRGAQAVRDVHGEEETMAQPTEASSFGAVFGGVRVDEEVLRKGTEVVRRGSRRRGRGSGGAVAAGYGEERGSPRLCLAAAEVGEVDATLGVAVKPAVWLVEQMHDESARVDGAYGLLQEPGDFAVVAEEHYFGGV